MCHLCITYEKKGKLCCSVPHKWAGEREIDHVMYILERCSYWQYKMVVDMVVGLQYAEKLEIRV